MTHTPGPWEAIYTDVPYKELGSTWTVDARLGGICFLDCAADEREANARLIAAAPDLLEALEGWIKEVGGTYPFESLEATKAAIAKAKGETQ